MSMHESLMLAPVAPMGASRASAYGLFTGIYGLSWFLGSALIGILYDVSVNVTAAVCLAHLSERSATHARTTATATSV